jgi:hypothetical protein
MLCFVDESGDTGLKTGAGSSTHFTIALVLFPDNDEADACDQRISLLRRELGIHPEYEFHFSHNSDRVKESFFDAVIPYNFFYLGFTINKKELYGEGFKYKNSFYKYTCGLVFENAKSHLDNAVIVFDGNGSREFRNQLCRYLKKRINPTEGVLHIKGIKIQDSKKNNLIQMADMICGSLGQGLKTHRKDSSKYHSKICHREISWQVWPKGK